MTGTVSHQVPKEIVERTKFPKAVFNVFSVRLRSLWGLKIVSVRSIVVLKRVKSKRDPAR